MQAILMFIEYHILKKGKIIPILLFSFGIGACVYFFTDDSIYNANVDKYLGNILNVLGILLGFSISTLAILLSVENDNMKAAKKELIKDKNGNEMMLYKQKISLFESVTMELVYLILIQGFLLIANFVCPHFIVIESNIGKCIYSIDVSFMVYSIFLLIQNMLNMYFILTKKGMR